MFDPEMFYNGRYGVTPLHCCTTEEDANNFLNAGYDVNYTNRLNGRTPLHNASWDGHAGVVNVLLARGAQTDAVDLVGGAAPLHLAAMRDHPEVVKALVAHRADVNIKDIKGKTALHYACSYDAYDVAKILCNAGADIHILDRKRRIPFDVCRSDAMRSLLASRQMAQSGAPVHPLPVIFSNLGDASRRVSEAPRPMPVWGNKVGSTLVSGLLFGVSAKKTPAETPKTTEAGACRWKGRCKSGDSNTLDYDSIAAPRAASDRQSRLEERMILEKLGFPVEDYSIHSMSDKTHEGATCEFCTPLQHPRPPSPSSRYVDAAGDDPSPSSRYVDATGDDPNNTADSGDNTYQNPFNVPRAGKESKVSGNVLNTYYNVSERLDKAGITEQDNVSAVRSSLHDIAAMLAKLT